MTPNTSISDGVLELYAAQALPPDEAQAVEALLAQHPELQQELARIEAAVEQLAQAQAATPSPGLKQALMQQLPAQKLRSVRPLPWAMAAAVALLLLSGGLNVWLANAWQNSTNERNLLAAKQAQLANNQLVERTTYQHHLELLADAGTRRTVLAPANATISGQVTVFWRQQEGKTLILIEHLPPPPPSKQYQLWALAGGKPTDAGLLDYVTGDLQTGRKTVSAAEAFAITLEPAGGLPQPTLETLTVIGKVVG